MSKNKGEFIKTFLMTIVKIGSDFANSFLRESWHYKNLRIGGYDPKKLYNNLNNLKQRGILISNKPGYFKFSKKGKLWATNSIHRYFLGKHRKWDKKWRIVIFDVPEELKLARAKFRRKLHQLGFFMLQKSVFVFPYPCEEELGDICKELKLSDYVDVIVAENPGYKEADLRKFYSL